MTNDSQSQPIGAEAIHSTSATRRIVKRKTFKRDTWYRSAAGAIGITKGRKGAERARLCNSHPDEDAD